MKIINCAADCTIKTFIACRFDNKLDRLIIEGTPEPEQLLQAIIDIETEFNDLCGNFPPELLLTNRVNKMIARNKAVEMHFFVIEELIRRIFDTLPVSVVIEDNGYLQRPKAMISETLDKLKKFGISLKWNTDIQQFKKQFNLVKSQEKLKHVQLKELEKELTVMQAKTTQSKQLTKKEFYRLIHAVQNLGFTVSEKETSMYSFGTMCEDFFEMTQRQKGS